MDQLADLVDQKIFLVAISDAQKIGQNTVPRAAEQIIVHDRLMYVRAELLDLVLYSLRDLLGCGLRIFSFVVAVEGVCFIQAELAKIFSQTLVIILQNFL